MSAALDMREKGLADDHEDRSFLDVPMKHPDGSAVNAQLYGKDDGFLLASQSQLTLMQLGLPASQDWTLQRGWVEHFEITGTGKLDVEPGSRVLLTTAVGYRYFSVPASGIYIHYINGSYEIQEAAISILPPGAPVPPTTFVGPSSASPASGLYVRRKHSVLFTFNADLIPNTQLGPGWMQIGQPLDF